MPEIFSTQDSSKLATGMSAAQLKSFTFDDISSLRGIVRTRILSDLDRFFIPVQVRVNPEILKEFNRSRKAKADAPVVFEMEDEKLEITAEWQPLRASRASLIHLRSFEDATLGAATMQMEKMDDGYGGKHFVPTPVPAFSGLLEFAMPTERAKTLLVAST